MTTIPITRLLNKVWARATSQKIILANYWTHTLRILKLDTLAVEIGRGTMNILWSEAVVQRCSVKNVFLEISQNSHENTCVTVSSLVNFLKKRLWYRNFMKFLRTPFFTEHIWWLLLSDVVWEALYFWCGFLVH